jgi:DNA-binding NtrC family response regulator
MYDKTLSYSILIVDDDRLFLENLRGNLEDLGYFIISFIYPTDAIDYINGDNPYYNMILTDLENELEGYSCEDIFRASKKRFPERKVFAMSAYDVVNDHIFDGFLCKYSSPPLYKSLEQIIENTRI